MVSPRDVLNRLKWEDAQGSLAGVTIAYLHRGAPEDTAWVRGEDILEVGQTFLELPEAVRLPQHRIQEIRRGDKVVWRREDARKRQP